MDDEALSNKQLEVRSWLASDMLSITPFAFLHFYSYYFLPMGKYKLRKYKIINESRLKAIEQRASDIFIQIQSGDF